MSKQTKTAVIGVGSMGQNHVRILSNISNLVGIYDVQKDLARRVANEHKTKAFDSIEALISETRPHAATVCVTTSEHVNVAERCLKNNVATLVEKPMAATTKEALRLINVAKAKNTFVMTGLVERHNPVVKQLAKDFRKGKFGHIFQMQIVRVGLFPSRMKPRNVLLDLGIHDIDLSSFILNEKPHQTFIKIRKMLSGSQADAAETTLLLKETSVSILNNWLSPIKMRKILMFGSKMSVEADLLNQSLVYVKNIPQKAIKTRNYYESFSRLSRFSKPILVAKKEPLVEELKNFLQSHNLGFQKEVAMYGVDALKTIEKAVYL